MGNFLCKKIFVNEINSSKDSVRTINSHLIQTDENDHDYVKTNKKNNKVSNDTQERMTQTTVTQVSSTDASLISETMNTGDTYDADTSCEMEISSNDVDTEGDSGVEIHTSRMDLVDIKNIENHNNRRSEFRHEGTNILKNVNKTYHTLTDVLSSSYSFVTEENIDKRKQGRQTVRRHQSLPPKVSVNMYSRTIQKRPVLPGVVRGRGEQDNDTEEIYATYTDQKQEEYQALLESEFSTTDPRNRPRAARGLRTRSKSFYVRPKQDGYITKDEKLDNALKTSRCGTSHNKSDGTQFYNCSTWLHDEMPDIHIHIKRNGVPWCDVGESNQPSYGYNVSISIDSSSRSNGLNLIQRRNILTNQSKNTVIDCKARVNVSAFSDICEITLPTDVLGAIKRPVSMKMVKEEVQSSSNCDRNKIKPTYL